MATKGFNNYIIVPRNSYTFRETDALSRLVFGLIYDRWRLSAREDTRHAWTDELGIYCVYRREEIAEELGVTLPTVRRCIDQLVKAQLLQTRRAGKQGAWRYYPTAKARLAMGAPDGYADHLQEHCSTQRVKGFYSEKTFA